MYSKAVADPKAELLALPEPARRRAYRFLEQGEAYGWVLLSLLTERDRDRLHVTLCFDYGGLDFVALVDGPGARM